MNHKTIIQQLANNAASFHSLLHKLSPDEYLWKPQPDKWCLLEVVCHLYDEEREDFRSRVKFVLENPGVAPPMFDQIAWVTERNYIGQNYDEMLDKLLKERQQSIEWLQSLDAPNWEHAYLHPRLGSMSAGLFLTNWLAHDYLHTRQILQLKFNYLKASSKQNLSYAGNW